MTTPSTDELEELVELLSGPPGFAADLRRLIHQKQLEARQDEVDTAVNLTTVCFDPKSPFVNIENINNQVIAGTSAYLLGRQAQLQNINKESK